MLAAEAVVTFAEELAAEAPHESLAVTVKL
jgi:hypothetical protein